MLDENLPTFHYKPSAEQASSSVLYFTQNGSDPAPEYVLKKADAATNPASHSKYAAALTDPYGSDVIYAEVLVEPEWQQPTLSAAEVRAQNGALAAAAPVVPDNFTIQLYNPDQKIPVKMIPGSWNRTDAWEFEMPSQSFKPPSSSEIDRHSPDGAVRDIMPKIMFKWKKDGRLSKDMTCYMVGKSLGKQKSKEPDITVALYKMAREPALTVYEPNLQRVEVEDRKGLEIALVLAAEIIKDLYLQPRADVFNLSGASGAAVASASALSGRRKNSRPAGGPSPPPTMSGAMGPSHAPAAAPAPQMDAETRRVQAMVEREQREQERRDRDEQKRIEKMLEAEEKERRRRELEVAKETERLRKKYGVQGQELPSRPAGPVLPPRGPQVSFAPSNPHLGPPAGQPGWYGPPPPPARPVSAGPPSGPFHSTSLNSWWGGPSAGSSLPAVPPRQQQHKQKKRSGSGPYAQNPPAATSSFFGQPDDERKRVQKKRSLHF